MRDYIMFNICKECGAKMVKTGNIKCSNPPEIEYKCYRCNLVYYEEDELIPVDPERKFYEINNLKKG